MQGDYMFVRHEVLTKGGNAYLGIEVCDFYSLYPLEEVFVGTL